ncbi:MAG: arylsulfatase [Ferruginibacter sp.]
MLNKKNISKIIIAAVVGTGIFISIGSFKKISNRGQGMSNKEQGISSKELVRPNIVLIMADDMGYSDLGCYGGEIKTPNLDYLAANGLRFSQFYNTSRCCPTRASLLTGLYNHEAGIGDMTTDQHVSSYSGHLLESTVTLAEVLKEAGYHTAMAGKWHVSNTTVQPDAAAQLKWLNHQEEHPLFSPVEQYPTNRGFEKFYGTLWGVVDYYDPFSLVYGTTAVKEVPKNYYHTDAINDSAASFIRQFSKEDKPFFVYVAENAPHWPIQAPEETIEKYKDVYKVGWDAIREQRYKKMIAQKMINPNTKKLSARQNEKLTWADNPNKEYDARAMAVHAAMIDKLDQGVGRIIKALKETGKFDNTIILFLSDNGASPEMCANFGPGFDRPGETRAGEKIIYPKDKKTMPGPQTVYGSIGPEWANVCNTPFRYWKIESYEGGVHTPMIVHWPAGLLTKKGSITDQPGHVMDFMATFIELAKGSYPKTYHNNNITPIDGISLLPILQGQQRGGHDIYFNEHSNGRYARQGDWKIVATRADSSWQLFNIKKDGSETENLAAKFPAKVKELDSLWHLWAFKNKVLPKIERKKTVE